MAPKWNASRRARTAPGVACAIAVFILSLVLAVPVAAQPARAQTGSAITSANWSGEVETGSGASFTGVSGHWTVPAVETTWGLTVTVTWVGIGTVGQKKLVQAGTYEWSEDGHTGYEAFYETSDAGSFTFFPEPVAPGDQVAGSVTETSPGHWLLRLTDTTRRWTTQVVLTYTAASAGDAEWITERPSFDALPGALAAYGATRFTHLAAQGSDLSHAALSPVTMDVTGWVMSRPENVSARTGRTFTNVFTPPPPRVTGVAPDGTSGCWTQCGSTVRVVGQWFYGVEAVRFGNERAQVLSVTETTLTVRAPAGAATQQVTVVTRSGTSKKTATSLYWI